MIVGSSCHGNVCIGYGYRSGIGKGELSRGIERKRADPGAGHSEADGYPEQIQDRAGGAAGKASLDPIGTIAIREIEILERGARAGVYAPGHV